MEDVRRGNPLFNLLKEEWKYLGSHRKTFLLYSFFFFIAGAVSLATPLVIGTIFNSIQQEITSRAQFVRLIYLMMLLFGITIVFELFHAFGRLLEQRTGFFVERNMIKSKIKKVLELPIRWHKDNHSGDTIDKINRATSSIDTFAEHTTSQVIYALMNIFGSLIILFFIDFYIAAFALVYSVLVLIVVMMFDKTLLKKYQKLNKFGNKISASIFDYVSNVITVITLRLKDTVSKKVDERVMDAYETHKESRVLNEIKWSFATIAISLMLSLALIYKAYTDYTTTGVILIGTLYILYGYLSKVGDTFYSFASLYGTINRYDANIHSAEVIDEEFDKVKSTSHGNLPPLWDEFEVRNLDFSYEDRGKKKHLDNINLKIRRGQKIAFVGESGSGKSTILAVLRGLYSPGKGDIFYHGRKIQNGFSKLKNHITLIPQEPEVFNNTILYNITMDLKTKQEDLKKAIQMAQFEKVVERLSKGLKTNVLEKGVSLSGGEKQRLALARGLLAAKNSDIVLMDEPTSSVDSINEGKIHENIFKEFKNKTVISSVHRLHLLHKFDYIYLFDEGKLIGQGTFNEIKKNSRFASILRKSALEDKKKK